MYAYLELNEVGLDPCQRVGYVHCVQSTKTIHECILCSCYGASLFMTEYPCIRAKTGPQTAQQSQTKCERLIIHLQQDKKIDLKKGHFTLKEIML